MFLAPALYAAHAVLTGISLVVTNALGVLHGFGFSAGLFDFVINWGLATKPGLLIVIGLVFAVVYFSVFYTAIKWFDLKTPGRETDSEEEQKNYVTASKDVQALATRYLAALGGEDNLTQIDACITRLRLSVRDMQQVNDKQLKALGASGVVKLNSNNLQVVLGPQAEIVAGAMKAVIAG